MTLRTHSFIHYLLQSLPVDRPWDAEEVVGLHPDIVVEVRELSPLRLVSVAIDHQAVKFYDGERMRETFHSEIPYNAEMQMDIVVVRDRILEIIDGVPQETTTA